MLIKCTRSTYCWIYFYFCIAGWAIVHVEAAASRKLWQEHQATRRTVDIQNFGGVNFGAHEKRSFGGDLFSVQPAGVLVRFLPETLSPPPRIIPLCFCTESRMTLSHAVQWTFSLLRHYCIDTVLVAHAVCIQVAKLVVLVHGMDNYKVAM